MPLVGPPLEDLVDVLCESFPVHDKLKTFVRYRLREDVYRDYAAPGITLRETAERLIDTLDTSGLVVEFVKLVQKERQQHSAKLRKILRDLTATPKPKAMASAAQRLGTREGIVALISVVGAVLTGLTSFLDQVTKLVNDQSQVPPSLRWLVTGTFVVTALWAVVRVGRRRSYLRRPEKFLILPEDPHGFIGREQEVRDLRVECETRPLVFLLGESGSGKSTLVRIGLLPSLMPTGREAPRLVPIRLDASALEWEGALARSLQSEISRLDDEQLSELGTSRAIDVNVFDGMAGLPLTAHAKLLVVIDQLDDYFESHRTRLMRGTVLLSPIELLDANPDWSALANVVRENRVHLLFVCRIDSLADRVFRFVSAVDMPLFQIDAQLVTPLLDEITFFVWPNVLVVFRTAKDGTRTALGFRQKSSAQRFINSNRVAAKNARCSSCHATPVTETRPSAHWSALPLS